MVNRPPTLTTDSVDCRGPCGDRTYVMRYTRRTVYGVAGERKGRIMKKAIEQDTLAALVETGAAREFRVLRESDAWRLELRLGARWLPICSRREPVRYWRSLTAVGRFCETVGIRNLVVEF